MEYNAFALQTMDVKMTSKHNKYLMALNKTSKKYLRTLDVQ